MKKKIAKRVFFSIIVFIAMILFIKITSKVYKNDIEYFDKAIYMGVSRYQTTFITNICKIFTYLGGEIGTFIMALITFVFVWKKYNDKKTAMLIILNIVIITVINQILKHIMKRDRPVGYRLVNAHGYSFPSGHSMVAMGFYGYLIYLTWDITKHHSKTFLKVAMTVILTSMILFIGLSRIYLGVHYASDVCAGLLLSFAYLIVFVAIYEKIMVDKAIDKKHRRKAKRANFTT